MTLTHLDEDGSVQMVDVGDRAVSVRSATATGMVRCSAEAISALRAGTTAKGDVLTTAKLAGIMGAKRTAALIPLCHPIPLSFIEVAVDIDADTSCVRISATVRCRAQTGVEMEALTAVAVAGLTVIDMAKAIDPWMRIDEISLLHKEGGRSGPVERPIALDATTGRGDDRLGQ